jgi:hypothetical protein
MIQHGPHRRYKMEGYTDGKAVSAYFVGIKEVD